MQRKSLTRDECPIARSLDRVGEWWSILIMRDALQGLRRFDEFSRSLGIAPNMLTRRLNALVEAGMLERRAYSERPPRYEYVPTPKGEDFRMVLMSLLAGAIGTTPWRAPVWSWWNARQARRCSRCWPVRMGSAYRLTSARCRPVRRPAPACASAWRRLMQNADRASR
ncbi:hypothetical protein PS683_01380 [Pseudomonas fluorescens]|uniref:HTH hxlR-type domain-containing protein n=1 Tax=Pseudomonas fluorescens TaxID=294 RepID=A0A5E6MS63_PSEFL|nr:hypothetical protein PS683_01380 [Pseudomonas fluorescens]VVM62702.1 hypothetical protein PS683_01380 [Pseudomonas fluorescens]